MQNNSTTAFFKRTIMRLKTGLWLETRLSSRETCSKFAIRKSRRKGGWNLLFHAHNDDRGFDLVCVAKEPAKDDEGNEIPNVWRYHSGLAFQFPDGLDAEFRARSSVYKTGLMLSNGVGTIDHGYRGEVQGVFYDILKQPQRHYKPGDRFGQLIIPGIDPRFIEFIQVDELTETDRGAGGYGSSGK